MIFAATGILLLVNIPQSSLLTGPLLLKVLELSL